MKKTHFLILMIFCSCSNNEIEGTWIGEYINGNESYESLNTVVKIEDNRFYNQVLGLGKDQKLTSFKFTKNGSSILPNDKTHPGFNIESFSKDSLVLSIPQMEEFKLVYRKLHKQKRPVSWDPTGKSYQFNGNKSIAFAEYVNDSIMIEYGVNRESVSINKWWLENFEDYTFLIIEYPTSTIPLLIDSTSSNNVYLKSLEDKIRNYKYQQQEKEVTDNLTGEWILADKDYDTLPKQRFDPFSRNNIKHLSISKDSIELGIEDYQTKHKYGWTKSSSNRMIFLIGDECRVLKILSLKKNELALEIGLERSENKKRFIYQRE